MGLKDWAERLTLVQGIDVRLEAGGLVVGVAGEGDALETLGRHVGVRMRYQSEKAGDS